jgi:4-amino-4-deoxy-L-arabinose transferase-like glycosyltransferase
MARSKKKRNRGEQPVAEPAAETGETDIEHRASPEIEGMVAAASLPVLLMLPFLSKAYHVDDPLFVWTAKQIVNNPWDFYGFMTNWETTRTHMYEVMQNPPLLSYFLAFFGQYRGWEEAAMHQSMLIPTALAGLGLYMVTTLWCSRPFLATMIGLSTPAFLVSASQVMSDVPMVACWLWAMYLWQRGLDKGSPWQLVTAGVLIGAGALTKYYALSLVPLLGAYTVLQGKDQYKNLAYLLIPMAVLFAFEFYTYRLYNLGLLLDAASFASEHRTEQGVSPIIKTATTLVFMGGCLATTLFLAPCMWSWRGVAILAGSVLGVFVLMLVAPGLRALESVPYLSIHDVANDLYQERYKDPGALQLFQWSLWFVGGVHVFYLAARAIHRDRNAETLILLLWLGGTFTFTAYLNHHVNARVILPMFAAASILIVRTLVANGHEARSWRGGLASYAVVVLGFVFSLVLCVADFQLANSARLAASTIMEKTEFGQVYFSGHSGFQYYMEELGAEAIDKQRSKALPGDYYVLPANNWFPVLLDKPFVHEERVERFEVNSFVTTSHYEYYAGFYSDYSGRLPFVFGAIPDEEYLVLKLERLVR